MAVRRDKHKTPAFLEKANREQTKIQEKIHLKLQDDIYRLFQDGTYSDLTLPCGPTPMLLHRAILESRVPGLLEIICPEGVPNKAILNSVAAEDLRQFIQCVYQEDDLVKAWRTFISLVLPDKQEQKGEAVETGSAGDVQLHPGDGKEVDEALLGAQGGVASSNVSLLKESSEVEESLKGHTGVGKEGSAEGGEIHDGFDEVSGNQKVAKKLDPGPGESFSMAEVPQGQGEGSENTDRTSPSLPRQEETDSASTPLVNGIEFPELLVADEQGTDTASAVVGRPQAGNVQHLDVCQYVTMDLPMGFVPKPVERMEVSATDTTQNGAASSGSSVTNENIGRTSSIKENRLVKPNASEAEVVNGVASLVLNGPTVQETHGPDCNQLTKKSLLNGDLTSSSQQESCGNQVDSDRETLESPLHNGHVNNSDEFHQIVARLLHLPVPSGTLSENLMRLLSTSIFSDVALVSTDGTRVPAHRCLLHCRCEFFAAMLGGGWIESESHEIPLKGMSVLVMDVMLQFMYGGNASLSDDVNLRDLLGASDMYGLEGLKETTAFHLKRDWCHLFHKPLCAECLGLVPHCYALCESYGLPELSQTCLRWMSKNMDRFWVQKTFSSLPPEMLETCSKDVSETLTKKNVVEILFQLDKIKLSLPLGQSPWAEPAKEITSKTRKKVLQFACDYFHYILNPAFEDKYLKGMGWKVDVMEQLFRRVVAGLSLENANVNFIAIWQLYKKETAEEEWNPEAYTAVGGFYDKVYNYIVSNASYIVHTERFKTLPEELQKQIRKDAVYVGEGLSKTTIKKPVLSSSQRPKSGQVRRTLSHPLRASSPASSASSTSSTASAPSSSRSQGRGGGAGTRSARGAVAGPSRGVGSSSRGAGGSSRGTGSSSRGSGGPSRGSVGSSRSTGSRSARATGRGDAVGRGAGTAARGNETGRTRGGGAGVAGTGGAQRPARPRDPGH